jgi:phosphoribosyl 1,2-cyclic phosphodiesterase
MRALGSSSIWVTALYIVDATDRWQRPGAPAVPTGQAAAAAAARRLLLTHFWPDNDRQAARAAAEAAFGGEVLIAEEDLEVQLGPMGPAGPAG